MAQMLFSSAKWIIRPLLPSISNRTQWTPTRLFYKRNA